MLPVSRDILHRDTHIQEWAKVGLQLQVYRAQTLFLHYYLLIIVLFSIQTTVNLLLPIPIYTYIYDRLYVYLQIYAHTHVHSQLFPFFTNESIAYILFDILFVAHRKIFYGNIPIHMSRCIFCYNKNYLVTDISVHIIFYNNNIKKYDYKVKGKLHGIFIDIAKVLSPCTPTSNDESAYFSTLVLAIYSS